MPGRGFQPQHAHEEARAHHLDADGDEGGGGDDATEILGVRHRAEAGLFPQPHRPREQSEPGCQCECAGDEPFLQCEKAEHAGEARVGWEQVLGDGEDLGEAGEGDELHADDDAHAGDGERAGVELHAAEIQRTEKDRGGRERAEPGEHEPRHEEEPARAVDEHEAQMPPAVAPRLEMRRARASVLVQRDGDFVHAHGVDRGAHHHLAGEFHAGGFQLHAVVGGAGEGAQAAVEILDGRLEEQASEEGQHWIPEPAVLPRHRAGHDGAAAARHAAAHHEVVAGAEFFDEARGL